MLLSNKISVVSIISWMLLIVSHFIFVVPVSADTDRKAIMKYRQLWMEIKGQHNQAIRLLVKYQMAPNQLISHAETLAEMSDDMLFLFPPGSLGGGSRALPTIWDNNGKITRDFIMQTEIMRGESEKLVAIARAGNYKTIKKQLFTYASKACRGCHMRYRGED